MGISLGGETKFRDLEPGLFVRIEKGGAVSARVFTKLKVALYNNAINQLGERLRIRNDEKVRKVFVTLSS